MKLLKPLIAALALSAAVLPPALASEDLEMKAASELKPHKLLHSLFSHGEGRNPRVFFDGKRLKFLGFHNYRLTIEPENTNTDDDDTNTALLDLTVGDTTTSDSGTVGDETETPTANNLIEPTYNPLDQDLTISSVDSFLTGYKLHTVKLNKNGSEAIKYRQGTVSSETIPGGESPGNHGTANVIAKFSTLYKNKNNYLTYGYWVNDIKGLNNRMDWGASVRGPLQSPRPINEGLTGTAYYHNPTGAAGLIYKDGSFTEFETDVNVYVSFDRNYVGACIACENRGITLGGKHWAINLYDGVINRAEREIQGGNIHVNRVFRDGEARPLRGLYQSDLIKGQKTAEHAWLGKFSRSDRASGHPHLITGTYGVKFDPGSGETEIQGYFVAGEDDRRN